MRTILKLFLFVNHIGFRFSAELNFTKVKNESLSWLIDDSLYVQCNDVNYHLNFYFVPYKWFNYAHLLLLP